jgi:hypothetical protein
MDTLTLQTALYLIVLFTLIDNLLRLVRDTRALKSDGKSPLTVRNTVVILAAAVGEAAVIFLLMVLYYSIGPATDELLWQIPVFIVAFYLRNVGAYLAAWGLWKVFLTFDTRKAKKQIDNEKEAAL